MKKLTREEFTDRLQALHRARRIFIDTGLTDNINKAFECYQEMLAEHEHKIELTAQELGHKSITNRVCPVCNFTPLTFEKGCCGVSHSHWLCPRCDYQEIAS